MSRRTPHRRRRVASLACVLGVLLSGCAARPAEPAAQAAGFDAGLHRRLPADLRVSGTLRIVSDASYAPASFFAADGRTVVGFEPDLASALGVVLGVRVRYVVTDFVRSLDEIRAGRADVVMSAMTDTAARERVADFVNYFRAGTAIVVQRGNPHAIFGLGDLCGEVVAVERATVQVPLLRRSQRRCAGDRIRVVRHRTNADALLELRTGRAAAVLNDYPPAAYLATSPRTRADYQLASPRQYEPGLYGVAVPEDRGRLRGVLRDALRRLVASGDYTRILARWGVSEGAVDTITVNAG